MMKYYQQRWIDKVKNDFRLIPAFFSKAHSLKPLANVVALPQESDFIWRSLTEDPAFVFNKPFAAGWYLLDLELSVLENSANSPQLLKLYYDDGNGYHEDLSIVFQYTPSKTLRRIIWLPKHCQIRLDPLEEACQFRIKKILLKPVSTNFALSRMERFLNKLHDSNSIEEKLLTPSQLYQNYLKACLPKNNNYSSWIKIVEPILIEKALVSAHKIPITVFSVIIPVYRPNLSLLARALKSVSDQNYPYYEICIAEDGSQDPSLRQWLEEESKSDARIKVTFREANGHIAAASNSALAMASGDYVVLLDQDDELAENAFWLVADAIQRNPQAKIIYSDEDKIDEYGNRFEPHFKPDWSPDLFYSNNYISHLGVYDRQLVMKVGGFRVGVEGAQDYDLCLRCVAALENELEKSIVHLPYVLYHWRTLEGSTAKQSSAKSYTWDAGLKALSNYLSIAQLDAEAEKAELPNTYRVKYKHKRPLVSLIIPTRDQVGVLETCLTSILEKTDYKNYEIIVVDNQSQELITKRYFEEIAKDSKVRVLTYPHPFNYSAINNFAAVQAKGSILGLLNNDVEVISPDWLDEMVMHVSRPEIGCVGAKLLYPDNRIQHAGIALGVGGIAGHTHRLFHKDNPGYFGRLKLVQNFSAVTAACLLVRTELYNQVNGLDAENLTVAFNDVDFCLRIRELGYRNLWTPYALLYHHESLSRGSDDTPEKAKRFAQEIRYMLTKWGSILFSDPYYHAAFSLKLNDFSLDTNENSDFIAGFKNFYLSN
ncbi:glycosyltransferase family 2 protein [Thiolinea disciformis]|uniref:glycosyltransferase family 2 protein n=1 Tax=Thiolinea disciformis TaxID=125614 RepID=UPI00037605EF|nr:glycosyltransferase family 2 protein [Thiolinea disciformis]